MNKKGFTLIEMMIVIAIVGILAAVAIPRIAQFRITKTATDLIEKGVSVSSVEAEDIRNRMIELLAENRTETEKVKAAEQLQKQDTNNTVIPVFKTETVPQPTYNTVIPVFIPPVVITCQDRDSLIAKCVISFNQHDIRYTLPIRCERTDTFNEYNCEVF